MLKISTKKMKYFHTIMLLAIAALIASLSACTSDSDKDGIPDNKDKCPNTPLEVKVNKDGCPLERKLGNIHFYIETSASMGGYFKKDAEYKTIVSDLTTKIEKEIKPIDIWFIGDSATKYNKDAQQFTSDIATTKIADQKSSQLHEIIKKIVVQNDSNDVSVLVSDCILSFPDKDIKANPEINKQEAPNALKGNIFSTFSDLKKNGYATSVYAFNSKFYGIYYDYQNGKHLLNGISRPFYVWVIGNKELLAQFDAQLANISAFKPEQSLHFGLSEVPVSDYAIIPQIEKVGKWAKEKNGIKDVKVSKNNPVQFCVALNLTNLPQYAKDINYLQSSLTLKAKGCDAAFTVKDKNQIDISKVKGSQINIVEHASHFVIITINEMRLNDATINLALPLQYDTWYLDWSVNDDKSITSLGKKTFAFEHLVNGVKEAYETRNKSYIDISIALKK